MRSLALIIVVAVLTCAGSTSAQTSQGVVHLGNSTPGYTYFNRPGADRADHDQDLGACASAGAQVRSWSNQVVNMQGVLPWLMAQGSTRSTALAAVENCMIVRRWRVVRVDEAEGRRLSNLEAPALAARIDPWIGAQEPHGEIVRVWSNDAARVSTDRFAIDPFAGRNDRSLSMLSSSVEVSRTEATLQLRTVPLDPKWPTRVLAPAELGQAPEGAVIIIVQTRGVSLRNGIGVALARQGPDEFTPPLDGGTGVIRTGIAPLSARRTGNWFALAVPPGQWRVAAILGSGPGLEFCLGAPAFEAAAGDVVYAGLFDLSAENVGPDLDLEAARTWLSGQPQAAMVRAAEYSNGWAGACLGANEIYALEVEGAPFREGYRWGGAWRPDDGLAAPSNLESP